MTSAPRVMHVRSSGALLGAERVVLELAERSRASGYEPLVVSLQDQGDSAPEMNVLARQAGLDSLVLPCRRGFDRMLLGGLREIVRQRDVSLVHCHGYKEDIHVLAARLGVPKVATNHLWKGTTWKLRVYAQLDALALRRFDHVVAVSRPVLEDMRRLRVSPEKMSVIPNGIDASPFSAPLADERRRGLRREFGLGLDDVVAISVSSLTVEKGHRYVLEAMPEVARTSPRLRWLVVGDGPLREGLDRTAADLGLSTHVLFAGTRRDVADLLRAADLFLLPSLIEGLPMALLEAMAAGLPAIATAVGDVATVIEDGRNGTLCAPASAFELGAALRRYASDAGLRLAHGSRARATVVENFSSTSMARSYCALYDDVLSRHGRH
jgi:glycosyltransferase involved in cell wall biosynthesis